VDSLNCLSTKTRYTHADDGTVVQSSELLLPQMIYDMFVNGCNVSRWKEWPEKGLTSRVVVFEISNYSHVYLCIHPIHGYSILF
jgi:hypothetical protein